MTTTKTIRKMIGAKMPSEAQDDLDVLVLAKQYMGWHRCKLCLRLTVEGYICHWCKGDDSE